MLALIAGTGLSQFAGFKPEQSRFIETPYGMTSGELTHGVIDEHKLIFLPRHGSQHAVPPHRINYRANLCALQQAGASQIIALTAVGGISDIMNPGSLLVPDQIIDYTWGRQHTFFEENFNPHQHIDFTQPYATDIRNKLSNAAKTIKLTLIEQGVYACVQGPRLETAAEVRKLKQDGCDIVGMTAMPEAALAKELQIPYAGLCMVVNWAAGISQELITMESIKAIAAESESRLLHLIKAYLKMA